MEISLNKLKKKDKLNKDAGYFCRRSGYFAENFYFCLVLGSIL